MTAVARKSSRHRSQPRNPVTHLVMPGREICRAQPRKNETISSFLRRTGWARHDRESGWQFKNRLPTVVEVNGASVLRKQWRSTRIAANDNVRFISYPLGGGGNTGKQILGLVALVAVSAFALWGGGLIAGAIGGTAGTIVGGLATAAIGLGGDPVNVLEGNK